MRLISPSPLTENARGRAGEHAGLLQSVRRETVDRSRGRIERGSSGCIGADRTCAAGTVGASLDDAAVGRMPRRTRPGLAEGSTGDARAARARRTRRERVRVTHAPARWASLGGDESAPSAPLRKIEQHSLPSHPLDGHHLATGALVGLFAR